MKGDRKIINHLNAILKNELTAINQYFLHSRMAENWGFKHLAEKEYEESIDEMKHADALIKRILFLEGLPNLQDLGRLHIGESVPELLQGDLTLEMEGLPLLRQAIMDAESAGDFVTRNLIREILDSEEEHVDWLETQLELVEQLGIQNYLQSQVG